MNPLFVALDTTDVHRAVGLARDLRGLVGGVKLGLEFFCGNGEEGVLRIAEGELPIFLDLKLHDI
ncbi:MAG: orotidine 5'-phosphate decarboxylase / HUMPS family protein, partial [Sphingomicrobium sp.]